MYNLIVGSANDRIDVSRFEKDYCSEDIYNTIWDTNGNMFRDVASIESYPTLLLPEINSSQEQLARVGYVDNVHSESHYIVFSFKERQDIAPIPTQLIKTNAKLFGMEMHEGWRCQPFELHHTHWAIKDLDLYECLAVVSTGPQSGLISACYEFYHVLEQINHPSSTFYHQSIDSLVNKPDSSVSYANSSLEGIIKTIAKDPNVGMSIKNSYTTKKLVDEVFAHLGIANNHHYPNAINGMISALKSLGENLGKTRNDATSAHGKVNGDYIIESPIWSELSVNVAATLGLFIWRYYQFKFEPDDSDNQSKES